MCVKNADVQCCSNPHLPPYKVHPRCRKKHAIAMPDVSVFPMYPCHCQCFQSTLYAPPCPCHHPPSPLSNESIFPIQLFHPSFIKNALLAPHVSHFKKSNIPLRRNYWLGGWLTDHHVGQHFQYLVCTGLRTRGDSDDDYGCRECSGFGIGHCGD